MKRLTMTPHNTKGVLITFCGLDGCGKSTLISMLTKRLQEEKIEYTVTKQPTQAVRNAEIFRTFMDSPDHSRYEYRALSLLAAADRIQHATKIILPALKEGKTVICDRYIYSCLANLRARGYEKDDWIYEISQSIPQPDVSFFLDLPVETAIHRVRQREQEKNRYIDLSLQYRLRNEYREICRANHGILLPSDIAIDDTFSRMIEGVYPFLKNI